jgi:hypothetical protein
MIRAVHKECYLQAAVDVIFEANWNCDSYSDESVRFAII